MGCLGLIDKTSECFKKQVDTLKKDEGDTSFQAEIMVKVGASALKLGLLMGTEDDPSAEEQQEVLSFHHLLLMEFCAGKYISTLTKVVSPSLFCNIEATACWCAVPLVQQKILKT